MRLPMNQSSKDSHPFFTVGHCNLEMSVLLGTLIRHEIQLVCDVRSRPGSFRFPQFNREPLMTQLASAKIIYQFSVINLAAGRWTPATTVLTGWWITQPGATRLTSKRHSTVSLVSCTTRRSPCCVPKKILCTATGS